MDDLDDHRFGLYRRIVPGDRGVERIGTGAEQDSVASRWLDRGWTRKVSFEGIGTFEPSGGQ